LTSAGIASNGGWLRLMELKVWKRPLMALGALGYGTILPSKSVATGIAADVSPPPVPVRFAGYDPYRPLAAELVARTSNHTLIALRRFDRGRQARAD